MLEDALHAMLAIHFNKDFATEFNVLIDKFLLKLAHSALIYPLFVTNMIPLVETASPANTLHIVSEMVNAYKQYLL